VKDADASRQAKIEEANVQLSEGLKSCRSMVENYRNMLGSAGAFGEDPVAANDDTSIVGDQNEESDSIPL